MKNVIITGSSRGIGFELVKLFNENDYKVIALSRNTKPISNLKLKNVHSHYLDISSSASINKTIKLIFKEFKKIDILINNAGTLINKPFNETSFEDFQYVYKVNVFGVAELIRKLITRFKTKSHVVNISSIGGIGGSSKFPGLSAYSSSKGALNILTEMLAEEFKDKGIINSKIEGKESSEWKLVDGIDIIVHIFHPEKRKFYELEKMWSELIPKEKLII